MKEKDVDKWDITSSYFNNVKEFSDVLKWNINDLKKSSIDGVDFLEYHEKLHQQEHERTKNIKCECDDLQTIHCVINMKYCQKHDIYKM